MPVFDLGSDAEQLVPDGVAGGIGERFQYLAVGQCCYHVSVNLGIVMQSEIYVLCCANPRDLQTIRNSRRSGAVELHYFNAASQDKVASIPTVQRLFPRRDGDTCRIGYLPQPLDVIVPVDRLLQPADTQRLERFCRPNGGRHVVSLVHVEHQVDCWADSLPHCRHPLHVLSHRRTTYLQLDGIVAHLHVTLALSDEISDRLAILVVPSGYIAGHFIAIPAQQLVHRHIGGFAFDVPQRNVDSCNCRHELLTAPASL